MAKVDELIEKYKGRITPRTINSLNNGDETKTKKYLEYMCKLWLDVRSAPSVIKSVKEFDELLPYIENKDIYHPYYTLYSNLLNTLKAAKDIKEEKTFIKEEHVDVLIENDDYTLLIPKTHRGSIKYGKGTKWCTAMNNHPGHFKNYTDGGYLIYLIRKSEKKDKWDKVAFYCYGNDVLTGSLSTYTSNDTEQYTTDILRSSWDISDIVYIQSFIRQYITYLEYKKIAKKEVKNIKTMLSNIDVPKLLYFKNLLSNDDEIFKDIYNTLTDINKKLEIFNN